MRGYEHKMFSLLKRGACRGCLFKHSQPMQRGRFDKKLAEIGRIRGIKNRKEKCLLCEEERLVLRILPVD